MTANDTTFEPGQLVRHPQQPEWGLGEVQSAIGDRVTVSFAEAGKRTINTAVVALEIACAAEPGNAGP